MPSIWKKATLGGLARLVSDLHTSKQRRSDLPLQTGFPTSLADLVVKHRDRLKRAGKKRHKDRRAAEAAAADEAGEGSRTRSDSDRISTPCEQSTPASTDAGGDVGVETAEGDIGLEIRAEPDTSTVEAPFFSGAPDVCDSGNVELVVERRFSVCSALFLIWVLAFGTKTVAFSATASVSALVLIRFLIARIRCRFSGQGDVGRSEEIAADRRATRVLDSNQLKKIQESASEVRVTELSSQCGGRCELATEIVNMVDRKEEEIEAEVARVDLPDQRKRSYVGCVIFILLALSGLVGGRIMALVLTVVCCLAIKLFNNIVHTN